MNNKELGLLVMRIGVSIITSIFYATVQVVWGVAGILLLGGMLKQYGIDPTSLTGLTKATGWILENYMIIIYSFFTLKMTENILEFIKDAKGRLDDHE